MEGTIVDIFQKVLTKKFSKRERVIVFLSLFILVLVVAWAFNKGILSFGKRYSLTVRIPSSDRTSTEAPTQKIGGESLLPQGVLRDPFSISIDRGGKKGNDSSIDSLKLNSILLKEDKPVCCVINDEIFLEGDRVAGKSIVKIEKDKVILKDEKREYELKIWEE